MVVGGRVASVGDTGVMHSIPMARTHVASMAARPIGEHRQSTATFPNTKNQGGHGVGANDYTRTYGSRAEHENYWQCDFGVKANIGLRDWRCQTVFFSRVMPSEEEARLTDVACRGGTSQPSYNTEPNSTVGARNVGAKPETHRPPSGDDAPAGQVDRSPQAIAALVITTWAIAI